ncbi:MAG TPA: DUF2459 domain-containing protein [Cellvibrionaceae bacterium]|nr:DUF2459 domain-containing protein [Cellvibrionaceae bacterium]
MPSSLSRPLFSSPRLFMALCYGLLACCLVSLNGCVTLPKWDASAARQWRHAIYYEYESWHSSIIIPAPLVAKHSERFGHLAAKREYLGFGYGDINYFTGRDTSLRSGAKALAFSDGPALQVLDYVQDPFAKMPPDRYVKLLVNETQLKNVLRYMDNSVALDGNGSPRSIKNDEPNTGFFFVAQGRYSMFSNCNTWAGDALNAAGLPISKTWGLTAGGVYRQAKELARAQERLLAQPY